MGNKWRLVAKQDIKAKKGWNKVILRKGETLEFTEETWRGGMVDIDYVKKVIEQRFGEEPDFGGMITTPALFEATFLGYC